MDSFAIVNLNTTHTMDTTITTTEELEMRVSSIIGQYREQAYAAIEEMMWAALKEAGACILENESLMLMTRRAINGISTTSLNSICRILEKDGDFSSVDEFHKKTYMMEFIKARSLSFEATRLKYPNYLKPWSDEDDLSLEQMWCEGTSVNDLAKHFGRNPGAINARIEKLELIEKYGEMSQNHR